MPKLAGYRLSALLITALLWSSQVWSSQVDGLYSAVVGVSDRSEAVQDSALNRALALVLVKVSGSEAVLRPGQDQAALSKALRNARSLVQEFNFQDHDEQIYLHAAFGQASIDRLLADSGHAVWGRERPATLVWLALDQQGQRFLLPSGSNGMTARALSRAAARRGVPINLPIMDISDRQALSYSDVTGGFADRILSASERYADSSVLAGRLQQIAPGQWDASWTHYLSGGEQSWSVRGQSLEGAMQSGVDGSADALAARYAARAGVSENVDLMVNGVREIGDYARVLNYLQGLSIVADVQPTLIRDSQSRFQVDVQGDRGTLRDVVALGQVLQLREASSADALLVFDLLH